MKLALDNHYSPEIAAKLRERSHGVIAAIERGWQAEDDEPLLELCVEEQRALMSNNVADFTEIARRWAAEGRRHCGLIFTSDASMPRGRDTIGRFVEAIDELFRTISDGDAFDDRVHWL